MVVHSVQCAVGAALSDGKAVGHWVAGDNVFGICVIVANLVLLHRMNLYDRWGYFFYAFSIGSYFVALGAQSYCWPEPEGPYFPKVFGTFGNAWG